MIVVFILVNLLVMFSSGVAAFRNFPNAAFSMRLVGAGLLWFFQVSVTVLLLGVVVRDLSPGLLFAVNGSISALVLFFERNHIKPAVHLFSSGLRGFSHVLWRSRDYFLYLLLFLFVFQAVVLLIKIYYLPPFVADVFAYHLHPVVEWFQRGHIPLFLDTPVVRAEANPLGSKLIHYWFIAGTGNTVWIDLPQFLYGLLLVVTVYAVMRSVGVGINSALRYAVLIYFIPGVLIGSRTAQDHLALTALTAVAVLYLLEIFYIRPIGPMGHMGGASPPQGESMRSMVVFLAMAVGLLLGTKISAPQVIAVLFGALLIHKAFDFQSVWRVIKANLRWILVGGAVVLTTGGYWYLKNYIRFGTISGRKIFIDGRSVWEIFFIIFSVMVLAAVSIFLLKKFRVPQYLSRHRRKTVLAFILLLLPLVFFFIRNYGYFKPFLVGKPPLVYTARAFKAEIPMPRSTLGRNLLYFPQRIRDNVSDYNPDFPNISGFGVQFFAFGLSAFFLMTGGFLFSKEIRAGRAGYLYLFSVLLMLSYFLYYFSPYNYRLLFFFPVFGLVLWAFLLSRIKPGRGVSILLDLLLLVMISFNMVTCMFEGVGNPVRWKTMLTMSRAPDRTTARYSHHLIADDWDFIDRYLDPGEPIGYVGGRDAPVYPYFDTRMKRKIYNLHSMPGYRRVHRRNGGPVLRFTQPLLHRLRELGIRFIHINPRGVYPWQKVTIEKNDTNVSELTKNLYYLKQAVPNRQAVPAALPVRQAVPAAEENKK